MTREWQPDPGEDEPERLGLDGFASKSEDCQSLDIRPGWLVVSSLADISALPTTSHRCLEKRDNPMETLAVASAALEALERVRPRLCALESDDICEELGVLLQNERSQQRKGLVAIVAALCLATAALVMSMHPVGVPPMSSANETAIVAGRSRAP